MSRKPTIEPETEELLGTVGLHKPAPIHWVAQMTGVSKDRIRKWKQRGYLQASGEPDQYGYPMYRGIDVLRAQIVAEQNAERTKALRAATRQEGTTT